MDAFLGSWRGTVRTWMGEDPVVSEMSGTFRRLFDKGTVVHEYRSNVGDHRSDGMTVLGIDIATNRGCITWVDTFHTGSNVLVGAADDRQIEGGTSYRASYAAGDQMWGWRIVFRTIGPDEMVMEHFNISPDGTEERAIEVQYRRV